MCGRFDFHGSRADIGQLIEVLGEMDPETQNYNLAPTQAAMAAHIHVRDNSRRLGPMYFGMPWPNRPGLVLNARSETAATKPMFRKALQHRRCLIFATGFYEWKKVGAHKQPYYFTVRNALVFAFAGLYTVAQDGRPHFVILTTEANSDVQTVHHRMPVILPQESLVSWLDPNFSTSEFLPWLMSLRIKPLQVYPVTTRVNSPGFSDPACTKPIIL